MADTASITNHSNSPLGTIPSGKKTLELSFKGTEGDLAAGQVRPGLMGNQINRENQIAASLPALSINAGPDHVTADG